ncbi:hypothetical protein HanPI659440_Chr11g0404261 [Helianthus annuus]|nr:hypothetical protein HanPI659440_Chr11g0404261 [Helianthus annuus]
MIKLPLHSPCALSFITHLQYYHTHKDSIVHRRYSLQGRLFSDFCYHEYSTGKCLIILNC